MKRNDAFPSKYLSKEDVEPPITATIEDVGMEKFDGDKGEEYKPVMTFREDVKPCILNNTNWGTIEEAYGEDSDNWAGKRITLYCDPNIMFGKKKTGGIRIRINKPAPVAAAEVQPLTLDQAKVALEVAGIPLSSLIDRLHGQGHKGYSPTRDSGTVRDMIAESEAAAAAAADMEEPF